MQQVTDAPLPTSGAPINHTRTTGYLLAAFPVIIQIPYSMLITSFDYPDILRMPANIILERFAEGAAHGQLTAIWYAFAMAIAPLLLGICLLPGAIPDQPQTRWLRAATPLGVASAVLQMAGLLRWVVLVPLLAQAWTRASANPASQSTIETIFLAQHQLFGVLLGEHLGQLLLGLWTLGASLGAPAFPKPAGWHRALGILAGILFIAGSAGSLNAVFPALSPLEPLSTVAFLIWSVWCCLLGVALIQIPSAGSVAAPGKLQESHHTNGESIDARH